LLATQIIADIDKATKVNINIKDILNAPTVAALSALVEEKKRTQKESFEKLTELLKKVQGQDDE